MNSKGISYLKLTASMVLFGTIGLFVRHIPLQSSMIALARGLVGTIFLLVLLICGRRPMSVSSIRSNLLWLCLSGACIGFNWMLLFESYRYTSVAVSTLCYYMAPILVILLSPIVLKEPLTAKKVISVISAIVGMVLISGVLYTDAINIGQLKGILFGLSAALLYAAVVLLNQKIKAMEAQDKTVMQLGFSSVVLIPYCILTYQPSVQPLTTASICLLLVVGIVHTGFTYYLYFASMSHLSAQSVAVISYLDPVVAVLLSVTLLGESMKVTDAVGAALILGAALFSEVSIKGRTEL